MSFRLPEPLADRLKEAAEDEGISMTELVARYSRMGLNLSGEDRMASLEALLENGMPLIEPYASNHAIVPTSLLDEGADDNGANGAGKPAADSPHLIREFENFIHLLEDSTETLNTDIREEMLKMIGQLSILKARLKTEPSLKRATAQS